MKANNKFISPISSFDIHLENYQSLIREFRKNKDISFMKIILKDCLPSELKNKVFFDDYDALVLTDIDQNILWVNDGFNEMTGYSKKFAVGKKPTFLQGEKTSKIVKNQLKKELLNKHKFNGSLINYRKNGETYLCQISILPLYNNNKNLKYYLAIEKELEVVSS